MTAVTKHYGPSPNAFVMRSVSMRVPAHVSLELLSLIYGVQWTAQDLSEFERVLTASAIDVAFNELLASCCSEEIPLKIMSDRADARAAVR